MHFCICCVKDRRIKQLESIHLLLTVASETLSVLFLEKKKVYTCMYMHNMRARARVCARACTCARMCEVTEDNESNLESRCDNIYASVRTE